MAKARAQRAAHNLLRFVVGQALAHIERKAWHQRAVVELHVGPVYEGRLLSDRGQAECALPDGGEGEGERVRERRAPNQQRRAAGGEHELEVEGGQRRKRKRGEQARSALLTRCRMAHRVRRGAGGPSAGVTPSHSFQSRGLLGHSGRDRCLRRTRWVRARPDHCVLQAVQGQHAVESRPLPSLPSLAVPCRARCYRQPARPTRAPHAVGWRAVHPLAIRPVGLPLPSARWSCVLLCSSSWMCTLMAVCNRWQSAARGSG